MEKHLRRIVGKTINWVLNPDIQQAAGPLQVSTGLKGGAEAAIHAPLIAIICMQSDDLPNVERE